MTTVKLSGAYASFLMFVPYVLFMFMERVIRDALTTCLSLKEVTTSVIRTLRTCTMMMTQLSVTIYYR
jgi:hypothetical protein